MTPLQIEILLHYCCRAKDHKEALNPPPAQADAFKYFVEHGYLFDQADDFGAAYEGMKYAPAEKLYFYCDALCKVPEPKQQWYIPIK